MNDPDQLPNAAIELWSTWQRAGTPQWSPVRGPEGETLLALEHRTVRPLVVDEPLRGEQLGLAVAWRVAFDAIILRIHVRARLEAFLRPLQAADLHSLQREELLRCDASPGFAGRRARSLENLLEGRGRRVILQHRHMLLAVLCLSLPPEVEELRSAAQAEIEVLRHLRASRMQVQELVRLLSVWEEEQRRRGTPLQQVEDLPVLRIITQGEDALLRLLRQRTAHGR